MPKFLIKLFLSIYITVYRLTRGRIGGSMQGFGVLLLTTTGRKSGKQHTTPLGYFDFEGGYVVTGSYVAWVGKYPAWFHNLTNNPRVTVQIKDRQVTALAERADPELSKQLWVRLVELAPGYADYRKRTTREIPMVVLHPITQV